MIKMYVHSFIVFWSFVKWATNAGVMKPVVVPTKLMIPYRVPAKFGARSCEFCRFVTVDAPLKPKLRVIRATHTYGCWTKHIPTRKRPGITWAMEKRRDLLIFGDSLEMK